MDARKVKQGDHVYYEGYYYQVAEVIKAPKNNRIGVYDSDDLDYIDYINPKNAKKVYTCHSCQGNGCSVCSGIGKIIES